MKAARYRLSDWILIAMMASLGIAVKVIVVPLAQIVTGPLFLPGGVVAGGIYMLFPVLGMALTGKRGAAFLICLVQAALVAVTGTLGSHGAASLITYTLPGVAIELTMLLLRHRCCCAVCCFIAGLAANLAGSFAVNLAVFHLPPVPMLLSLSAAALSGGLGGLAANALAKKIRALGILRQGGERR